MTEFSIIYTLSDGEQTWENEQFTTSLRGTVNYLSFLKSYIEEKDYELIDLKIKKLW